MTAQGNVRDTELKELKGRIQAASLFFLVCYLILIGRLVFLQVIRGRTIRREAVHGRLGTIVLAARRGSIYSRDGRLLGVSLYSGKVGYDPAVAHVDPSNHTGARNVSDRLARSVSNASLLLGIPEPRLREMVCAANRLYAKKKTRFYTIKRGLTIEQATAIRQAKPGLFGFGVRDGVVRAYSSAGSAAQVIGFTNVNGVGMAGLERGCDTWLTGKNGYSIAELDHDKRAIPLTVIKSVPARDGQNVVTTLDANAQRIATEEAQKVVVKYHPVGVAVVIVEPSSGDVLALVSLPAYDANPIPAHPDRRAPISLSSLKDRCVGDTYEPGSTLKTLTVAGALDQGVIKPSDRFYCSGQLRVGRRSIHCANGETHHCVDAEGILRDSCNIGAAQIGLRMGGRALLAAITRFGLLDPPDLGLPVECVGSWTSDPTEQLFSPGKTARVAFGHAITATPLHVAMAYAAIANGGVLMRPRLVMEVTDGGGHVVHHWAPRVARRAVSARTSTLVRTMLRSVVSGGTGTVAAIHGYNIAGKTGTASKYKRGAYVGSFTGFLPAGPGSKPRAVILVAVDTPDATKAYFGADVAAPAFRAIASRLMNDWRVPEDDPDGVQALAAANSIRRKSGLPALAARTTSPAVVN